MSTNKLNQFGFQPHLTRPTPEKPFMRVPVFSAIKQLWVCVAGRVRVRVRVRVP